MAAFITAIVLVTSLVYFIVITGLLESFSGVMSELGAPNATFKKLTNQQSSIMQMLVLYQILVCSVIFVGCILFTHRIAGPIYKLRKFLSDLRNGAPRGKLFFRKGDYFHEVADDINVTFDSISEDYKKDFVYVSEVNAYLKNLSMVLPEDKKTVLEEISKKLAEIQNRFNEEEYE